MPGLPVYVQVARLPAGENIILRSMLEIDCIALYVVNVAKKQREVWASKTGRIGRIGLIGKAGNRIPKSPRRTCS